MLYGPGEAGWVDIVVLDIAGAASMDVSVLEPDGMWFEWSLLIVYMYLPTCKCTVLPPFGRPPMILYHSL